MVEFDSVILGGIPVAVKADIGLPEPDVGLPNRYINDISVFYEDFLIDYTELSEIERERLENEALDCE